MASDTIIKSYKYRIYPNHTQAERLDFMLWQGRKIYNGALAMRKEAWEEREESISKYDLRDYWAKQRYEQLDTIGQLPGKTVEDIIFRLDKAYKAFFRRVKSGEEKAGFPRFKGRWNFKSLGFTPTKRMLEPTSDGWAKLNISFVGSAVRIRYHRQLPEDARIKMAVVKRETRDQWYVVFQCEQPTSAPLPQTERIVGIDIGLTHTLALSDGQFVDVPKWYQDGLKRQRVLMRKLDRQRRANNPDCYNENGTVKEGRRPVNKSRRMQETERLLRKHHAKLEQQRWYFWHTITDWLTKEYDVIALEDLTLDFMIKNKRLAMHTLNSGFGMFWQMLEYKASERGVEIVKVPPAYTSQTCSECGVVDAENRKTQASFVCVSCGHSENADTNAAKNILRAALNGAVQAPRDETQPVGANVSREGCKSEPVSYDVAAR